MNQNAGYDDGNKDRNNDENAASGSGSDGPIFDPIMMPRSCGRSLVDNGNGNEDAVNYISKCRTIYLTNKYHIKDVL